MEWDTLLPKLLKDAKIVEQKLFEGLNPRA